jgi:FAD/FMN-containing dehydrogenase
LKARAAATLESRSDWRVLDGFGRAVNASSRYLRPRNVDELREILQRAAKEGLPITFRGAGRSYGDASLSSGGLSIDTTALDRVVRWDADTGVIEAEPGLSIEGVWRRTLPDGWWPTVVPGTMRPTIGGCVAMNIHGKNNFRVGGFGDQLLEVDLITVDGQLHTLGPDREPELFRAVVGGAGLLGAVSRVKFPLKRVYSGRLRVHALAARSLDGMFDIFEQHLPDADYLVGWVDCFASGAGVGRGQVHAAHYLKEGEDSEGSATLALDRQDLPSTILGFPKRMLWRVMRPFMRDPFIRMVNWAKYWKSRWDHGTSYLQSHVAFAFLLDYIPDWRLAYGPAGFIQYQIFVPHAEARGCFRDVLRICQRGDLRSYLGVLKRHRPDNFLLTHALDGWSLALDFPVRDLEEQRWRARVGKVVDELTERVLAAGGRFYFAKDATMRPQDLRRAFGEERLAKFAAFRDRLDPTHRLTSDLARRLFGDE